MHTAAFATDTQGDAFLISTCTALQGLFCHLVPARILSVRIPGTVFAMYKNHLLKGALLLTAAGVFSRIIGFFYRIFLSRTFGAEQMGIYELISPVLALSFALCTSAIQSSISKFTAAEPEAAIYAKRRILLTGLSVSFVLSCLCTLFVWREADFISDFLLKETRCAPLLKIAALSFPAACIHSCINGYYYGIRKSFLPAFCQVFEQCFRVGSVMVFWQYATARGLSCTIQLAAVGLVIGECCFHGGFRFCRKNPFFQKTPRKPSAKAFSAGAIFQTVFLCCTPVRHAGLPASARNNRILPHPGQPSAVWLFLPSGAFCLWRIHRHGDDLHPVSRRADQFDCCPAHADHLLRGRFE